MGRKKRIVQQKRKELFIRETPVITFRTCEECGLPFAIGSKHINEWIDLNICKHCFGHPKLKFKNFLLQDGHYVNDTVLSLIRSNKGWLNSNIESFIDKYYLTRVNK